MGQSRGHPEEGEVPYLQALGDQLREWRRAAGLSRERLGWVAGISAVTIWRIETARQRTRPSTLARLTRTLTEAKPELGDPEALAARLVALAGPALAKESERRDRIERRRDRRARRQKRWEEALR